MQIHYKLLVSLPARSFSTRFTTPDLHFNETFTEILNEFNGTNRILIVFTRSMITFCESRQLQITIVVK